MADFDPEKFEDKYANYFPELQQAYKNAFNRMNDRYDSELVHAIDQQVLNESEPFYVGGAEPRSADDSSGPRASDETASRSSREHDGEFRVELPDDPYDRVSGVVVDEDRFEEVLEIHVEEIERELERIFGFA